MHESLNPENIGRGESTTPHDLNYRPGSLKDFVGSWSPTLAHILNQIPEFNSLVSYVANEIGAECYEQGFRLNLAGFDPTRPIFYFSHESTINEAHVQVQFFIHDMMHVALGEPIPLTEQEINSFSDPCNLSMADIQSLSESFKRNYKKAKRAILYNEALAAYVSDRYFPQRISEITQGHVAPEWGMNKLFNVLALSSPEEEILFLTKLFLNPKKKIITKNNLSDEALSQLEALQERAVEDGAFADIRLKGWSPRVLLLGSSLGLNCVPVDRFTDHVRERINNILSYPIPFDEELSQFQSVLQIHRSDLLVRSRSEFSKIFENEFISLKDIWSKKEIASELLFGKPPPADSSLLFPNPHFYPSVSTLFPSIDSRCATVDLDILDSIHVTRLDAFVWAIFDKFESTSYLTPSIKNCPWLRLENWSAEEQIHSYPNWVSPVMQSVFKSAYLKGVHFKLRPNRVDFIIGPGLPLNGDEDDRYVSYMKQSFSIRLSGIKKILGNSVNEFFPYFRPVTTSDTGEDFERQKVTLFKALLEVDAAATYILDIELMRSMFGVCPHYLTLFEELDKRTEGSYEALQLYWHGQKKITQDEDIRSQLTRAAFIIPQLAQKPQGILEEIINHPRIAHYEERVVGGFYRDLTDYQARLKSLSHDAPEVDHSEEFLQRKFISQFMKRKIFSPLLERLILLDDELKKFLLENPVHDSGVRGMRIVRIGETIEGLIKYWDDVFSKFDDLSLLNDDESEEELRDLVGWVMQLQEDYRNTEIYLETISRFDLPKILGTIVNIRLLRANAYPWYLYRESE